MESSIDSKYCICIQKFLERKTRKYEKTDFFFLKIDQFITKIDLLIDQLINPSIIDR